MTGSDGAATSAFSYVDSALYAERVPLSSLPERFGTPCFVYSRAALETEWRAFDAAFGALPHLVCYAVKANGNLGVLDIFARLGSGFDIVSGGELARVVAAGGDPTRVVFSGVGKTEAEMEKGLGANILCFNVESASELSMLAAVAQRMRRTAPVSFRVNPDVDPRTHPYIATGLKDSKFGIGIDEAGHLYRRAATLPSIAVRGIDIHIGSQITDLEPYRQAVEKVLALVDDLSAQGIALEHIDVGGGLGIRYRDETPLRLADYAAMLVHSFRGRRETLVLEPGRRLVGDAGVLLTRVLYLKVGQPRRFAVIDAAMNDLIRPSLYDAWHAVDPVMPRPTEPLQWDIVGPVCESADFLAHDRMLALDENDLLAVRSVGAHAMTMSSNYNARPRACEVIVDGTTAHLVRQRETVDELFAHESRLP